MPCPPPGDLPNPGIEPRSPTLQADSLSTEPTGKPNNTEVGSLSLLQGTFLAQELNQGLLHCRRILYQGGPNYHTVALISHPGKVMLKLLQARLQQCMNLELPDVQVGFRKGRGIREIKLPTSTGSKKMQENSRKTSDSLTTLKPLTVWITINCGKFLKSWEYQTISPAC